jgi:hypothetical protein
MLCVDNPFAASPSNGLGAAALRRDRWGLRHYCLPADDSLEVLEEVGIKAMLTGERWRIWGEQSGEGFE